MSDLDIIVTEESWISRIIDSIKGVVFGLLLFIIGFPVLFFNEGRAVKTARSLQEGSGLVVSVDSKQAKPKNNGQLVHLTNQATTSEILQDRIFKITAATKSTKFRRRVEMYQWEENKSTRTEKKLGGGQRKTTVYKYKKDWKETLIDSARFHNPNKHYNPSDKLYPSKDMNAKKVEFGGFVFAPSLKYKLSNYTRLALNKEKLKNLPDLLKGKLKNLGDRLYTGDPSLPKVGDLRISFSQVKPAPLTVVAMQKDKSLLPFKTSNGRTILLLKEGTHNAQTVFQMAADDNTYLTWILRFAGFLLLAFGIGLMISPLVVVADLVPFVGDLLQVGVSVFSSLTAMGLAVGIIAVGWISYRPLVAIPLLILAVGAFVFLIVVSKKKKAKKEHPAQDAA